MQKIYFLEKSIPFNANDLNLSLISGTERTLINISNELAKDNIRVNSVIPGLTNTQFLNPLGGKKRIKQKEKIIPMGRSGEPKEIAEAVAWLLSESASYITGASIKVSGGL